MPQNSKEKGRRLRAASLAGADFVDCRFEACNLSMVRTDGSALKGVVFHGCKLVGFDFAKCSDFLFAVTFEECNLDLSNFAGRAMKNTAFEAFDSLPDSA